MEVPETFEEAVSSGYSQKWKKSHGWRNCCTSCKWNLGKYESYPKTIKYYHVNGFMKVVKGVDFNETFSNKDYN